MVDDTVLVGVILLLLVPLLVWDGVNTLGAGFNNAFWALPLDEKLDGIADRKTAWHRISWIWIVINGLLAAGLTAFTFQLSAAGEPVWAALGLGAFLLVATMFAATIVLMATTVSRAAALRKESGTTPSWLQPAWDASWWVERAFVVGANLAYVAWGVGMVQSGFPAEWAGWVAIVTGALGAVWATFSDYFFQHMALVTPLVIGVALLLY